MVIIDIVINTILGGLTLDPAGRDGTGSVTLTRDPTRPDATGDASDP